MSICSTWDSPEADELWTAVCGKHRWRATDLKTDLKTLGEKFRNAADADIWGMRQRARKAMIEHLRMRLARQVAGHGGSPELVALAARILDPDTLTLGFARRFATYKRPNLLLHDRDRLLRILTNRERPVQLVLAGKAHPADMDGQAMIREWIEFIRHTPARSQAVFLSDDDMGLTEKLVRGVDVWLNTPRRPWEASGTSGMKVLPNGGLNCSELDGWWAEAYAPEVGWALGDGQEHGDDPGLDAAEATRLYEILEQQVIPEYYARNETGVSPAWVGRIRESMARLTPQFSSARTVLEYTEQHYLPRAQAYLERAKDKGKSGGDLLAWRRQVEEHWPGCALDCSMRRPMRGSTRFRYRFGSMNWLPMPWRWSFTPMARRGTRRCAIP